LLKVETPQKPMKRPIRTGRIKLAQDHGEAGEAYYHCVSRVVDRQFIFGDTEKEMFVQMMRKYERFYGVRVMTFCIMSNHFHILVHVPKRPEVMPSDEELLSEIKRIYSMEAFIQVRWQLQQFRKIGADEPAEELRESFFKRMWDVSFFMKSLKQRFSAWYNKKAARTGTLWEQRFRSVLVQSGDALMTMAAYIDLNPIRAGMVEKPEDYRWSGYSEAMAGRRTAGSAIRAVVETHARRPMANDEALAKYRGLLYGEGEAMKTGQNGGQGRKGLSKAQVQEVIEKKGKLSRYEMLRCRVRYFTDGVALGTKEFVNTVFTSERARFGEKRKTGARRLSHVDAGELRTLRALRVDAIS
jgi:putative transposase